MLPLGSTEISLGFHQATSSTCLGQFALPQGRCLDAFLALGLNARGPLRFAKAIPRSVHIAGSADFTVLGTFLQIGIDWLALETSGDGVFLGPFCPGEQCLILPLLALRADLARYPLCQLRQATANLLSCREVLSMIRGACSILQYRVGIGQYRIVDDVSWS